MNFVYYAEKKLERFYDSVVERTEERTTRVVLREGSLGVGARAKGALGSLLKSLGLPSFEVEADISTSGRLSVSNQVVSQFTSAQKLKALLLILEHGNRLVDLNTIIQEQSLPKEGSSIVFSTRLKADTGKRNEYEIERTKAVIFTGILENYTIEIQASLVSMSSENAWRRLEPPGSLVAGFGSLIRIDSESLILKIDPIAFGYVEAD
jgi:hypothetical protein